MLLSGKRLFFPIDREEDREGDFYVVSYFPEARLTSARVSYSHLSHISTFFNVVSAPLTSEPKVFFFTL